MEKLKKLACINFFKDLMFYRDITDSNTLYISLNSLHPIPLFPISSQRLQLLQKSELPLKSEQQLEQLALSAFGFNSFYLSLC